MKRRTITIIPVAVAVFSGLFLFSGCQTAPEYNFESDPEANFTSYQTFALMPLPSKIPGAEPGLILQVGDTVKSTLEDALTSKGYTQVDLESADFVVNVNGKIVPKVDVSNFGYQPYQPYSSSWSRGYHHPYTTGFNNVYVDEYEEGTLTVEIYDVSTKKLAWVGWTVARMSDKGPDLELVAEKVRGVIEAFPAVQDTLPEVQ